MNFILATGLLGIASAIAGFLLWKKSYSLAARGPAPGQGIEEQPSVPQARAPLYERMAENFDRENHGRNSSWFTNYNTMSPVGAGKSLALMLFLVSGICLLCSFAGLLKLMGVHSWLSQ